MKIIAKIFIFIFLLATPCGATQWYVDNAASGTNVGTSWTDAWESFADVVWSGAGIVPGDTLNISGGSTSKTYTEKWTIGASGTSENVITIRPGQDENHNGVVIFDHDGLGDSGTGAAIVCKKDYITFDAEYDGSRHIVIKNLRNTSDRQTGFGIYGYGVDNLKIRYVEFINMNNPITYSNTTTNLEVSYCSIQARGDRGIQVFNTTQAFDTNLVHHNSFECLVKEGLGGPDGIQANHGISIFNNTFVAAFTELTTSTQHTDFLQITGDYVKIYNNDFKDPGDSAIDYDLGQNGDPHDIWIYNNIFRIVNVIGFAPEYIRIYLPSGTVTSFTNIKIMNNLFVDNDRMPTSYVVAFNFSGSNPTTSGCEIKNNIFYNCGNSPIDTFRIAASTAYVAADWDFDNNIWYDSSVAMDINIDGQNYTGAEWIAASEPNGSISEPLFASYSVYNNSNDYSLHSSDTVAMEQGVTLAEFDKDILGITRPQGSAWEIGPYEFDPEGAASGTIIPGGCLESDVVDGSKTIVATLSGDELVATFGADNEITTAFIQGFDSAQSEGGGWNAKVRDIALTYEHVTRTSATVATVILPAVADYQITANETITLTIPATSVVGAVEIVCTPTFQISAEQTGSETRTIGYSATGPAAIYDANGPALTN